MKWLDYSLSLCKRLQSYLSYKHNTVLDYDPWPPGAGYAPGLRRGIYIPKSMAGLRWDCGNDSALAPETWWQNIAGWWIQCETMTVKRCQSVLPGTPHPLNQGPPSDGTWYVEETFLKHTTAIERLKCFKQRNWETLLPLFPQILRPSLPRHPAQAPHQLGLPSPPSQCNLPLLEKTSKSQGLFEEK